MLSKRIKITTWTEVTSAFPSPSPTYRAVHHADHPCYEYHFQLPARLLDPLCNEALPLDFDHFGSNIDAFENSPKPPTHPMRTLEFTMNQR